MDNELLLQSSNDIPFIEAQVNIHQPTISEISLIGEENFFSGCKFLNFSKNILSIEDRIGLEDKSDFEVFMLIMCSKERIAYRNSVTMVLSLLFPQYMIKFTEKAILLSSADNSTRIDKINYDIFKDIISAMFGLNDIDAEQNSEYNPASKRAEKLVEKFKKRKAKLSQQKGEAKSKIAVLNNYISILAVGEGKDKNELMCYTFSQLRDEFKRFKKKYAFDIYMRAKLAGAKDLDEVDNWMETF